jgi:hypothetical protein
MVGIVEDDKVEQVADVVRRLVILKSPNGTLYKVIVDDNGNLDTEVVEQ